MMTEHGTSLVTSLSNSNGSFGEPSESGKSSAVDDGSPSIYDEDAVSTIEKQILVHPHSSTLHLQLAFACLLRGRYEQGWQEYEWRQTKAPACSATGPMKRWQGEPLSESRLLVMAEQGLGDTLQFLRYMPFVASVASEVILQVPKTLKRLVQAVPGVSRVFDELEPTDEAEYFCPIMSLPFHLRHVMKSIPSSEGYLYAAQHQSAIPLDMSTSSEIKIGLVWAGNPRHVRDSERSISFSELEPLFQLPGAKYFSFQVGEARRQLTSSRFAAQITDLSPWLNDMQDTANFLSKMDVVVTVDTAIAHLGGALGIPVWVMLAGKPDWRWKQATTNSDWYWSMRLFRQSSRGDWARVVSELFSTLMEFSVEHTLRGGSHFDKRLRWGAGRCD